MTIGVMFRNTGVEFQIRLQMRVRAVRLRLREELELRGIVRCADEVGKDTARIVETRGVDTVRGRHRRLTEQMAWG